MRFTKQVTTPGATGLMMMQYLVLACIILYFGRAVFVPLSFSLLISFVLYPVCAWLERKGLSRIKAVAIALTLLLILGLLILALLITQFVSFLDEWPTIQLKLGKAMTDLSQALIDVFGVTVEEQQKFIARIADQSGSSAMTILRNAVTASALSAVLLFLIPVYAALILYYRNYWMAILNRIFPLERHESLREIMSLTIQAYYNFIKGMAVVYLAVGVLNSIGLLILGVPHAILFGFVASVLTFIPYVGIMVGSLLPITMAWITYDSIWYPVGIIAIFTFVQYLEANLIFPMAVSSRLNVNTLVMLLAIFIGGILWGMAGMILFVPFVGIAKLIADRNPKMKTLSMILGTGER
jgi:predicted PurR-regulated permease PerM